MKDSRQGQKTKDRFSMITVAVATLFLVPGFMGSATSMDARMDPTGGTTVSDRSGSAPGQEAEYVSSHR